VPLGSAEAADTLDGRATSPRALRQIRIAFIQGGLAEGGSAPRSRTRLPPSPAATAGRPGRARRTRITRPPTQSSSHTPRRGPPLIRGPRSAVSAYMRLPIFVALRAPPRLGGRPPRSARAYWLRALCPPGARAEAAPAYAVARGGPYAAPPSPYLGGPPSFKRGWGRAGVPALHCARDWDRGGAGGMPAQILHPVGGPRSPSLAPGARDARPRPARPEPRHGSRPARPEPRYARPPRRDRAHGPGGGPRPPPPDPDGEPV